MKKEKLLLFFMTAFCFNMAASFVHPVTPTLIVERSLDSSMFGVALAAMMTMNFLFSPFWGRLCAYVPTKRIMLICCVGYAAGQLLFGSAYTEAAVVGGRMFAGIFTGGVFTAMSNYVINLSGSDTGLRGRRLVVLTTIQNVGSACGYFVGGMLGLLSVWTAFIVQVICLVSSGIGYMLFCKDDTGNKPKPQKRLSVKDVNPFAAFLGARNFMTPLLAMVFMIVAISAIGQNSYEQCFNYYIKDQYGMSSAYNGMFKAGIACLTLALNSTVSMYLQKNTDINKTFLYILAVCTALICSVLIFRGQIVFIAVYIIYSSVMVLRLPLLQAMSAAQSTPETSNAVMGFYQSMNSLGGIFGALFAGLIYSRNPMYPFILAFIAFLVSTLIGIAYRKMYAGNRK
ncbi:MAG: MFS transporter [Erysipelotrichaceae bacterium]|nr:MFS transporter [Erysipelotrichaceae bacterium]